MPDEFGISKDAASQNSQQATEQYPRQPEQIRFGWRFF
jgi:hypothetical protein